MKRVLYIWAKTPFTEEEAVAKRNTSMQRGNIAPEETLQVDDIIRKDHYVGKIEATWEKDLKLGHKWVSQMDTEMEISYKEAKRCQRMFYSGRSRALVSA